MTRPGEAGLSLVEVTVSLLLLGVALLGIGLGFPRSRTAVATGNEVGTAVSLARQTLEAMRNRLYTSATDEITAGNFPNQGYGTIVSFPTFRRTVTIQNGVPESVCVPPSPPNTPCTKTVTVTVFYTDHSGQERSVALTTIFVR
jgi:Tfp pilus assembly protein PilV